MTAKEELFDSFWTERLDLSYDARTRHCVPQQQCMKLDYLELDQMDALLEYNVLSKNPPNFVGVSSICDNPNCVNPFHLYFFRQFGV